MPDRSRTRGRGTTWAFVGATALAAVGIGIAVDRAAVTPAGAIVGGSSGLREVPPDRTLEPGAALTTASPQTSTTLPAPDPPPTPDVPARPGAADLDAAPDHVNARVTAFGDSVMLEAEPALAAAVSDLSLDAVNGRQAAGTLEAVRDFVENSPLGDVVVVQVGNNGLLTDTEFDELMSLLSVADRVLVVNVKVDREWEAPNNDLLAEGVSRWPNAVLLDWYSLASSDPEALLSDGVHLRPPGARLYTRLILSSL